MRAINFSSKARSLAMKTSLLVGVILAISIAAVFVGTPFWLTTRAKNAAKREGSQQKLALDDVVSFGNEKEFDVLALEDALLSLEKLDPRQVFALMSGHI